MAIISDNAYTHTRSNCVALQLTNARSPAPSLHGLRNIFNSVHAQQNYNDAPYHTIVTYVTNTTPYDQVRINNTTLIYKI